MKGKSAVAKDLMGPEAVGHEHAGGGRKTHKSNCLKKASMGPSGGRRKERGSEYC